MNQTLRQPPSLESLRETVRSVCAPRPVLRVEAFGSWARGTSHVDSDVDLLVEFLPDAQVGLFEMGDLKEELEEKLGCHVDLISRRAIERSSNPYRRQSILASPVIVYDR